MFTPELMAIPIVQAPMAGGPSTPELAAAAGEAGGLGFLAAGYKTPAGMRADVESLRALSRAPFGVNVFAPPGPEPTAGAVEAYGRTLESRGALGDPRHDDDAWHDKLASVAELRVPVVSFTFGCPDASAVATLHAAGCAVWVTTTTVAEAAAAQEAGIDALVVQGVEAGGHRGTWDDSAPGEVGLMALLQATRNAVSLPLVATGGIAAGPGVAAALAAGAAAVQVGSALMLAPEAGTSEAHRRAFATGRPTALTRAYTGRTARGIVNDFMRHHHADAPSAYPEVHHLTQPLRAAARDRGDLEGFHLWAGQAYGLARPDPAGHILHRLMDEAREALGAAARRLPG